MRFIKKLYKHRPRGRQWRRLWAYRVMLVATKREMKEE